MTNVCMCTLPCTDPTACSRCSVRWNTGWGTREWRDEPPVHKKTITIDYDEYLRLMRLDGFSQY